MQFLYQNDLDAINRAIKYCRIYKVNLQIAYTFETDTFKVSFEGKDLPKIEVKGITKFRYELTKLVDGLKDAISVEPIPEPTPTKKNAKKVQK